MIETYEDKETRYANLQRNGPIYGNTIITATPNTQRNNQSSDNSYITENQTNTSNYSSPTNSIPPQYNINGTLNTNTEEQQEYNHEKNSGSIEGIFYAIFNKSNIIFVVWFLAIYFIAYFVLGFLFNKNEDVSNHQLRLSRTIDIISLFFLLIVIITTYTSYTQNQKEHILETTIHNTEKFINEPISIFSMSFFLLCFYVIVYLFRIPMDRETKPIVLSIIETVAWILFVIIIFTDFFKYVLGISFTRLISKLFDWSNLPENAPRYHYYQGNVSLQGNVNLKGNTKITTATSNFPSFGAKDEVFNISNNIYTYDDAQSVCSVYGAKLATYDQIEDAYKNGGEWCNYGWSDGQMAFFPTQKATWDNLQKDPKQKNNCGRPGVNGGYFANPYIKFGVNCYGKKPIPTTEDLDRMNAQKDSIQPKSEKDVALDNKVKFWRENADKLLQINSYNKKQWSEY
jgi:hypothetical protein